METRALDGYGKPVMMTTLDNGTTVISFHKKQPVARYVLTFATGSMQDAIPGEAHFLEHMVMEGPSRGGIHPILSDFEARGMTDLTAQTSRAFTRYGATTFAEYGPELLARLFRIVTHPEYGDADVEAERLVIVSESQQNRFEGFSLETERLTIPESASWNHPVTGDEADITRIQHEDLEKRHANTYRAGNLLVIARGEIDHQKTVDQVARLSADLPSAGLVHQSIQTWHRVASGRHEFKRSFFNSSVLSLVFDGVPVNALREGAMFMPLVGLLFGGMRGSLFKELRVKRKLVYMTSGTTLPLPLRTFQITLRGIDPKRCNEAETYVQDILQNHIDNGFDPESIECVRADELLGKTVRPHRPSFGIIEEDWLYGNLGRWPDPVATIRDMKNEDLRDMMRLIYDPNRYTRFLLLPE